MKIYDSHSATLKPFIPLVPGEISLYVCGVTVYDRCHLGHARVYMVYDAMIRYWRSLGWRLRYVRNITDIDDKIIQRAAKEGISIQELSSRSIAHMHQDFQALGLLPPDVEPKATEWIQAIIDSIQSLIDKGIAYQNAEGDICFSVDKYPSYGQLSGQSLDHLRSESAHERDFALWKKAKEGEPFWHAPWGPGRPGWHIECSAMSIGVLGPSIDIHGGGHDLLFPHHENERAQSECLTGQPFVHYWMHVGFVEMHQEKMSKSLGNVLWIHRVLEEYHPEVLRLFFLQSHYRSPLPFEEARLRASQQALNRLYQILRAEPGLVCDTKALEDFYAALDDDFNTPIALSILFEKASLYFKTKERHYAQAVYSMGSLLGFFQEPDHYFTYNNAIDPAWIEQKIADRAMARARKDFAEADRIRQELLAHDIVLEDTLPQTTWKKVPKQSL